MYVSTNGEYLRMTFISECSCSTTLLTTCAMVAGSCVATAASCAAAANGIAPIAKIAGKVLCENEDVSTLAAYSAGKTLQAVWSSSLRTAVPIVEKHLFSVLGSRFTAAFCSLLFFCRPILPRCL